MNAFRVSIRYPRDVRLPDDDRWLAAAVARHDGTLHDGVLFSNPGQRVATFVVRASAESFVNETDATGRWRSHLVEPTDE